MFEWICIGVGIFTALSVAITIRAVRNAPLAIEIENEGFFEVRSLPDGSYAFV